MDACDISPVAVHTYIRAPAVYARPGTHVCVCMTMFGPWHSMLSESRSLCAHDLKHARDRCIFTRTLPFAREHAVSTLTISVSGCRLLSCVSSYGPCSLRCHSPSGVTRQAVSIVMPRSFTTLLGRQPALVHAVLGRGNMPKRIGRCSIPSWQLYLTLLMHILFVSLS
jgi:hypothetical protein